jgi:hypothetical protein
MKGAKVTLNSSSKDASCVLEDASAAAFAAGFGRAT